MANEIITKLGDSIASIEPSYPVLLGIVVFLVAIYYVLYKIEDRYL